MADSTKTQAVFSALLEAKNTAKGKTRKVENIRRRKVENDEEMMGDVVDNIQVITDPEKSVDDLETVADKIQDIIEDTPEGEVAFSDEYVGDNVYACPVCGEKFFADETYEEGDLCPICKAEPTDGFLNCGVVAAIEDEEIEDVEVDEEDELEDTSMENDEMMENRRLRKAKREASRRRAARNRKAVRENEAPVFNVDIDIATKEKELEVEEPKCLDCELDSDSFDEALTEFVKENYGSSCKKMAVRKAFYNESTGILKLECRVVTKANKSVPVTLALKEAKYSKGKAILKGFEMSKSFKIESKQAPFTFRVYRKGNELKCESMAYNYITRHNKVGRVKVEGLAKGRK